MLVYNQIESLVYYANAHLLLDELDSAFVRNQILELLGIDSDYIISEVDVDAIDEMSSPHLLLQPIVKYAIDNKVTSLENATGFGNKIMSILSKKPSEIADIFLAQLKRKPDKATQWLYDYAIKSNYIDLERLALNKHWEAKATAGKIEITINLAKPEYSVADIANKSKKDTYPLCSICVENEGYAPNKKQNLRTVPLTLGGQDWFMQYSPYSYFNQHMIAINTMHTPMQMSRDTLIKLFDFNDCLPHYFIGCNAQLPAIGGTILEHEHFQGGQKILPLFLAKDRVVFKSPAHPLVTISEVEWYNNCIRAVSLDRHRLIDFGTDLIEKWQSYNDEECGVVAATDKQHNSLSMVVRRDKADNYVLECILRSNITTTEYPHGVFCTHPDRHNIKKEAIGLIEAMGLFVLPGRLDNQMQEIAKYLTKDSRFHPAKLTEDMQPHEQMIEKLLKEQGSQKLTQLEATLNIKDEINAICEQILVDTAVFKQDTKGKNGLVKFFDSLGLVVKAK